MVSATNKTVLVTGVAGFVGCWVSAWVKARGFRVIGVDDYSSNGQRLFDMVDRSLTVDHFERVDVCDLDRLKAVVERERPDVLLHFAGQAIVPEAHRNPFVTYRSNMLGVVAVLEVLREYEFCKTLLVATSDKVYENHEWLYGYREVDQLGGKDCYSASKSAAEMAVRAYTLSHLPNDKSVHTLRLGNILGGGDFSINRLMPDLYRSWANREPFRARYLNGTRPFQSVLDVAGSVTRLLDLIANGQVGSYDVWNLGPRGNSFASVSEVLGLFTREFDELSVVEDPERVKEDINLAIDVTKLSKFVMAPRYDSLEAIKLAVAWYKEYALGKSPGELLTDAIENYASDYDVYPSHL